MADTKAVVNIAVNGLSKIDKVIGKLSQLESIVGSINTEPLNVDVRSANAAIDTIDSNIKALGLTLGNSQKKVSEAAKNIEKYSNRLERADSAISKLNPGTKAFEAALNRQKKATNDLFAATVALAAAEEDVKRIEDREMPMAEQRKKEAVQVKKLSETLNNLANNYFKVGRAQQRGKSDNVLAGQEPQTIAQLNAQAQVLGQVAANSKIASIQFNKFTIASQMAGQAAYSAQQQQLKALAFGLSAQAPSVAVGPFGQTEGISVARKQVGELIASYGGIVKSEAAMGAFYSQAKKLQSLVPHLSDEFNALEDVLALVDRELAQIGRRGQSMQIMPKLGPATDLGTLKAFTQRYTYEKKITDEASRQVALGQRIAQASLNEIQRAQLRNQLEQASNALFEQRLEDAQRYSRQVDRQRFSLERVNRRAEIASKGSYTPIGETSPIRGQKIKTNILRSGEIIEQSLLNLQAKNVDVTSELVSLQNALNNAKSKEFLVSQQNLDALSDQVAIAGHYANLQSKIASRRNGGGAGATEAARGTGLQQALEQLQQARGARLSFFGDVSPAQAIDQIVRTFNEGAQGAAAAATNITETLSSELKSGTPKVNQAGITVAEGLKQGINDGLGIASPSKFIIAVVQNLVNTYMQELRDAEPRLKSATEKAFGQRSPSASVRKLVATNRGFEFVDRPSTGYRPLRATGSAPSGMGVEMDAMMKDFRNQIANLTTQPEIYRNILNAIPDFKLTTNLAGLASKRAGMVENFPSFLPTQRALGPGDLEKEIEQTLSTYLKDVRVPNPWIGIAKDYKAFIQAIKSDTTALPTQKLLAGSKVRIAGALPPAETRIEARVRQARERSNARGVSVLARDAFSSRQLALPPAGPRTLQSTINDLFRRISSAVRGSLAGAGGGFGGRPPGGPPGVAAGAPGPSPGDFVGRVMQAQQQGPQALLGLAELRNPASATINELNALSAVLAETRANLDPLGQGFDRLDNQLRETIANIGRMQEQRAPDAGMLARRFGPRTAQGLSEGLIGGAFPLLFGQGGGAAFGGGLGGFGGGFAGGGLGFGLSLVGTAVGTAIDTFVANLKGLAASLEDPTAALEALKVAGIGASKETEKTVRMLMDSGDAYQAHLTILQEVNNKLGVNGVKMLQAYERQQRELDNQLTIISSTITSALLPALVGFNDILKNTLDILGLGKGGGSTPEDKAATARAQAARQGITQSLLAIPGMQMNAAIFQALSTRGEQVAARESGRPGVKEQQRLEAQLGAYKKNLETLDIGRSFIDAARQANREQKDLDKQRSELVRSYEESIAEIRRRIEDEIANKRFALLEKENQLLDMQGENRIKKLELLNKRYISNIDTSQPQEVQDTAKAVAQIVADFTEQQLTVEEQAAKTKRDAALDARKIDFEAARFKVDIEREVSRLNIETARQVSAINEQVIRRNEDANENRLRIEKAIAIVELTLALQKAKEAQGIAQQFLENVDAANKPYAMNLLKARTEIVTQTQSALSQVESTAPPQRLKAIGQVGGRGISTSGMDALFRQEGDAIRKNLEEAFNGFDLTKAINIEDLRGKILEVATSIEKPLKDVGSELDKQEKNRIRYRELISQGYSAEIANRMIEIEQMQQIAKLNYSAAIAKIQERLAQGGITESVRAELQDRLRSLQARRDQVPGLAKQATDKYLQSQNDRTAIQNQADVIQEQLNLLMSTSNQVIQAAGAIGAAFSESFTGVINGTMTAQEALASFFQNIAKHFMDMAAQIIAKWIEMTILNSILQLFPGGSAIAAGSGISNSLSNANAFINEQNLNPSAWYIPGNAKGNAFASNGIVPFAMGGIVNTPTLFRFANGGAMQNGVMGETGPEGILPLKRGPGGVLGVHSYGGGGGDVNVTVNVDASGSKVSGDDVGAKELGRVVTAAVQSEIIKQQRPGGLLNR